MKRINFLQIIAIIFLLGSCKKEYSQEGGNSGANNIIGADCRISKIVYADSASGVAFGSIAAIINSGDQVTTITDFDSLGNSPNSIETPFYVGDTMYRNADEYFVLNPSSKLVKHFHGLLSPLFPLTSPAVDIDYAYNAGGYLTQKIYSSPVYAGPYIQVDYTYTNGNLTHVESTNLITGDLVSDADLVYNNIVPKNFMYLFPDELTYQSFNQFLNFGKKSQNAIAALTVNEYDPGNIITSTSISTFSKYVLSVDNYVLSCIMDGDDQPGIPVQAGKLSFSYKSK